MNPHGSVVHAQQLPTAQLRPHCRCPAQSRARRLLPQHRKSLIVNAAGPELAVVADAVRNVVDTLANACPAPLQPVVSLLGNDVASALALSPTFPGIARLSALYYTLLTRPNPLSGIFDFYVAGPLTRDEKKWSAKNFWLRDKLGGGNFGVTFEGVLLESGERIATRNLTPEQKKRRVVLKRCNLDKEGVRKNFLQTGTLARGAAETGQVEAYMCSKLRRNPVVKRNFAEYLGSFTVEETENQFPKGTQWLVWKFESDSTVGDALDGYLGSFPACLEEIMLGRVREDLPTEKRDALVVKEMMREVCKGVATLHSMGIVHRDIKPDNLLVTVDGNVKIIDFGAAADMCTGINFNPEYGMLDPRYSPPEELVMPRGFPKAPQPVVAAILSPLAWLWGRPDLFDSYSLGVLLLQLSIPQLRRSTDIKSFNNDVRFYQYDLERWRAAYSNKYDFSLLDRNSRSGWDLATRLIAPRNQFNRGRLSASQVLLHRYFLPEF